MLKIESPKIEETVFRTECPVAVPVQITADREGGCELLVYSFCEALGREFEARFGAAPVSGEAVGWLTERLSPLMEERGYDECDIESCPLLDYRPDRIREEAILSGCELIASLDGERWGDLPLEEYRLDPENPVDRMAVIRDEEGKIVCYAGLNDISEEEGFCEIAVECVPVFRSRGFGASCTALLMRYLTSLGERCQYVTSHLNVPSVRCAEKAGLRLEKTVFPFIFRRSGEDDGEYFDFT